MSEVTSVPPSDPLTDLRAILDAALHAADPGTMVRRCLRMDGKDLVALAPVARPAGGGGGGTIGAGEKHVEAVRIPLTPGTRVKILAIGKAAVPMAAAAANILGDRLSGGLVITKHRHADRKIPGLEIREAGHPVPDAKGLAAADAAEDLLASSDADTVLLVLLSGGGSALLADPFRARSFPDSDLPDLSLPDLQAVSQHLLASGAPISEINCVRKHLSRLKGGRLAALARPARVLSLILSDVIGDDLSSIASGPTAPDSGTFADALAILDRYGLRSSVPRAAREVLEAGAAGLIPDTPAAEAWPADGVVNLIVGSGLGAIRAAAAEAEARGYAPWILTSGLVGEAREMAGLFPAVARDLRRRALDLHAPACVLAGGETTVTLGPSPGTGGRNQELGLAVLSLMSENPDAWGDFAFASLATDGTDGPTDAAGAIFASQHLSEARAQAARVQAALNSHDALPVLRDLGALLETGPTGTNVNDLQVLLLR